MDKKQEVLLENMTWKEAEAAIGKSEVALIPIGTMEQHAYHLPNGTDSMVAKALAKELARQHGKAVVYPLIAYGNSETMMDWPGTITIQSDTLIKLCSDVVDAIARVGFKKILFVNGHGGNIWELAIVCKAARRRTGAIVGSVCPWIMASSAIAEVREQGPRGGVHACEVETAIAMAAFELEGLSHLINMDLAQDVVGRYPSRFVGIDITGGDSADLSWDMNKDWSPTGAIGEPSKATLEKGRYFVKAFIKNSLELIKDMDSLVEGRWITKS